MLPKIETILYTTDVEPSAVYVFRYALALAQQHHAKIVAVHGMEPLTPFGQSLVEQYITHDVSEEMHKKARETIKTDLKKRIELLCAKECDNTPSCENSVSSIHVVDYDTITGEVRQKNTHQGYADESSWARGQAWGLYGFTMTYRCTKDKQFLDQAEKIAGFLLNHPRLPEDLVPYWDFDAPGIPNEERDVSAGAIIASALYELSTYSENGAEIKEKADLMLESLGSIYASPAGENYGFILHHSVGNKHGNSEVDVPLNYADYYFLEALVRQERLANNKPVV